MKRLVQLLESEENIAILTPMPSMVRSCASLKIRVPFWPLRLLLASRIKFARKGDLLVNRGDWIECVANEENGVYRIPTKWTWQISMSLSNLLHKSTYQHIDNQS
jgi:hypothetical protein